MNEDILWAPGEAAFSKSGLARFATACGFDPKNYTDLHRWSVRDPGRFWSAVWDFADVQGEKGDVFFVPDETAWMTGARFFPDARLNLAENLLCGPGADVVVYEALEDGTQHMITRAELRQRVGRVAQGLRSEGVMPGDRVAGVMPNTIDGLVAVQAALSIGAVWTSCSPDFGTAAIVDRIGQVDPKVLFAAPRYRYGGKEHDIGTRIAEIMAQMPSVKILVLSGEGEAPVTSSVPMDAFGMITEPEFARLPFDHPAYILYTSGTTGAPRRPTISSRIPASIATVAKVRLCACGLQAIRAGFVM